MPLHPRRRTPPPAVAARMPRRTPPHRRGTPPQPQCPATVVCGEPSPRDRARTLGAVANVAADRHPVRCLRAHPGPLPPVPRSRSSAPTAPARSVPGRSLRPASRGTPGSRPQPGSDPALGGGIPILEPPFEALDLGARQVDRFATRERRLLGARAFRDAGHFGWRSFGGGHAGKDRPRRGGRQDCRRPGPPAHGQPSDLVGPGRGWNVTW